MEKVKVAWVCHFANAEVLECLRLSIGSLHQLALKLKGKSLNPYQEVGEYSVWVTNGIHEFEHFTEQVELHVISPIGYLSTPNQNFECNGIHYHFVLDHTSLFVNKLLRKFSRQAKSPNVEKNWSLIKKEIEQIQPDVIYVIGAESELFSPVVLQLTDEIPVVVQLQTLMSDPEFKKNYPISDDMYDYRAGFELQIIKKADYIGTTIPFFIKTIKDDLKIPARFVGTCLAVGEQVRHDHVEKQFDFVYFAAQISKAADWAIEAFALATREQPGLSLLVVGDYDSSFKEKLDHRMRELGIMEKVTFTGRLETHEDVLMEIQKARFAIIPLKVDMVSGTIRESMACGLPVCTTITPGTPLLNEKRKSVLLSGEGDFQQMAENMLSLIHSEALAEELQQNGFLTLDELYGNRNRMEKNLQVFQQVVHDFNQH